MPTEQPAKSTAPGKPLKPRALTEADAIDIWIARWLRVRQSDLQRRYGCDSRRLYDIWWGIAFSGSRQKAKTTFTERFPAAAAHTDFGYRRIPRGTDNDPRQGALFD